MQLFTGTVLASQCGFAVSNRTPRIVSCGLPSLVKQMTLVLNVKGSCFFFQLRDKEGALQGRVSYFKTVLTMLLDCRVYWLMSFNGLQLVPGTVSFMCGLRRRIEFSDRCQMAPRAQFGIPQCACLHCTVQVYSANNSVGLLLMVRASSEPGAQRWKPFNRVDRAVERNVSLTTYFDHACKPIRVNVFCALEARNFVSLSDSNLLFSCRIRHCLSPTAYSLTRDAAAVRRHNYVFRLIVFCYESFRVRRHPVVKN